MNQKEQIAKELKEKLAELNTLRKQAREMGLKVIMHTFLSNESSDITVIIREEKVY